MNSIIEKRIYTQPQLEYVKLDSEISLSLESPPPGPDETYLKAPEYFNNNPYNSTTC